MRSSFVLSALSLAAASLADLTPGDVPTRVQRDIATVSSVVAQVSGAITQLDTSVKAFSGDATKVTADSTNLLTVLKSGVSTIQGSTDLSLTEALGLQSSVSSLQTASDALVADLGMMKTAFEQARLCSVVSSTVTEVQSSSKGLIDAVVAKVPSAAQSIASSLTAGLQNSLSVGVGLFANGNCTDAAGAAGAGTGTGTGTGNGGAASAAPASPSRAAEPTMSMGAGGMSGGRGNATTQPTGGMAAGTSGMPAASSRAPVVTAAASANTVGSAGLVAALFAALML